MTLSADLMRGFADRTGLSAGSPERRYLWTDAFAVCNLLTLERIDLALALIDRVHHVLGRHRDDDPRRGWISGLSETEGQAHPTLGGLRIGKRLPERPIGHPIDERREWDRDGQYFHYLTKWTHALDQCARVSRDEALSTWARELAATAHRRFVYGAPRARRMFWKMSIDLTRPQVASMGQHDPLDGYVTCLQLGDSGLATATEDFRAMIDPDALGTGDPLGIGGLLVDASRLAQLERDPELRLEILAAARIGLHRYASQADLEAPAEQRLAFRELGLAIGLAAFESDPDLARYSRVRESIVEFWTEPSHRESRTYRDHVDINDVMLATALSPSGFIELASRPGGTS